MLSLSEHIQLPQSTFVLPQPPPSKQYGPPSELSGVPSILYHVGFMISAPPHKVTLKPYAKLPTIRQYNLPHKSIAGIEGVIQSPLDQGVLVQTSSPCSTPILPIPKANRPDEWGFVQDLQAINNIVVPTSPIVPDTNSILASLPSNSTHYTVIDLFSAFFSILLRPDSKYLFAHSKVDSTLGGVYLRILLGVLQFTQQQENGTWMTSTCQGAPLSCSTQMIS